MRTMRLFLLLSLPLLLASAAPRASLLPPDGPSKGHIRLFPNPTFNGSVSVVSHTPERIYFYIFDLEGTLVHQSVMARGQKITVRDLRKGIYLYDVFKNDISVEQGKIMVK